MSSSIFSSGWERLARRATKIARMQIHHAANATFCRFASYVIGQMKLKLLPRSLPLGNSSPLPVSAVIWLLPPDAGPVDRRDRRFDSVLLAVVLDRGGARRNASVVVDDDVPAG